MNPFSSLSDDFYVNMNLTTEMELPANREAILHLFERVQKTFPTMRHFYCLERGDFVLEEDKDQRSHRWCTIQPRRVCSGQINPDAVEGAMQQHQLVLDLAPYSMSVSRLDCEAPDRTFGETLAQLAQTCHDMIEGHVIEHILHPLARTIACK